MSDAARDEPMDESERYELPYRLCPHCGKPWRSVSRHNVTGVWERSPGDVWELVMQNPGTAYQLRCEQLHVLTVSWEMVAPELQAQLDAPDVGGEMRFEGPRGSASLREAERDVFVVSWHPSTRSDADWPGWMRETTDLADFPAYAATGWNRESVFEWIRRQPWWSSAAT